MEIVKLHTKRMVVPPRTRTGWCVYRYALNSCRTLLSPCYGKSWQTHETLFSLLAQKFIRNNDFYVDTGRKKESMNVESTTLPEVRKTTYIMRRQDTDLEFFFPGFLLKFICLLIWSSPVGVWFDTPLPQNESRNFRLSSHCPGSCSLGSLPLHIRLLTLFPIQVVRFLPPGVWGEGHNRFRWFNTYTEDLGPPGFFLVIFN